MTKQEHININEINTILNEFILKYNNSMSPVDKENLQTTTKAFKFLINDNNKLEKERKKITKMNEELEKELKETQIQLDKSIEKIRKLEHENCVLKEKLKLKNRVQENHDIGNAIALATK